MRVYAAKKYGVSQSTVAAFLNKRKQIGNVVSSIAVNPQRTRLEVATNENIDAAVLKCFQVMMTTYVPINVPLLCAQAQTF